jgi:hypothetical protein
MTIKYEFNGIRSMMWCIFEKLFLKVMVIELHKIQICLVILSIADPDGPGRRTSHTGTINSDVPWGSRISYIIGIYMSARHY